MSHDANAAVRALARFTRGARAAPGPRCELCATTIGEAHAHVVDRHARRICCACQPCATLFSLEGAGGGRYRRVPDRVLHDPALQLDDAAWNALAIPVRLAFFFAHSDLKRVVAIYPGPAGTTEAEPDPTGWAALRARTPLVDALAPDVEALLVHGARDGARFDVVLAPIATAYELAARVRKSWRGFDGGPEVRGELETFFAGLRAKSRAWRTP